MTLPMHPLSDTYIIYYMTHHCFLLPHLSCFSLCCFSSLFLLSLLMLLMMDEGWSRQPFTTSQLQELERQALIFSYMALGIPVPSHLVLPFKRSFSSDPFSLHPSCKAFASPLAPCKISIFFHFSCLTETTVSSFLVVKFGRKAEEDPEPWRCRRTDGKKWRCSGEASGGSKYCERHRQRGKKCSTKTAEMPLLAVPSYYVSSPSPPYCSAPLPLTHHSHSESHRFSSGQMEKKQEHCFVFGADLKLSENREVQGPKLQPNFFRDFPDKRNDPRG